MNAAVTGLAEQALDDVLAEARVVTRVAVTVRTSTFCTRTKIRKLDAPTTDRDTIVAAALRVLDLFSWTARSACSGIAAGVAHAGLAAPGWADRAAARG